MQRCQRFLGVLCLAWCGWSVSGPLTAAAAQWDAAELEAIVNKSSEQYIKAFNARNPEDLVALFTPAAEYVDGSGVVFHGHDAILAEFTAFFESTVAGELLIDVTSIRPVADSVIIEEGTSEFRPENDGPISFVSYTATHVKQADGGWKLASVRELSEPVRPLREQLKRLRWLIGGWRDESPDAVVDISWRWSDDGNFLLGTFDTKFEGQAARQGSHRIGWDAERQQFRSWIFTTTGVFAEGVWLERDGVWEVALSATLPDGTLSSGTIVYERDGEDALIVSQVKRQAAGEPLPDLQARMVRTPPPPMTSK